MARKVITKVVPATDGINTDAAIKTDATIAAVAAAKAETPSPAKIVVAYAVSDVLAKMGETVVATQSTMETLLCYAILATARGATSKIISNTIKTAAAERGSSDSYAGRIAIESRRFAEFVLTMPERAGMATATLDEAFTTVNAAIVAFNTVAANGDEPEKRLPWRGMYDRLAALDPEAVANAAKKAAKVAADVAAESIATDTSGDGGAIEGANENSGFAVRGATDAFTAVKALLSDLTASERDEVAALIAAMVVAEREVEPQAIAA